MEIQLNNELSIQDIIKDIDNYDDEVIACSLQKARNIKKTLNEMTKNLEGVLINRMTKDNATKIVLPENSVATLQKGKMDCPFKNADQIYKEKGFSELEIGFFEFKPSWTKAKEARKIGGEKQKIIDELFVEGKKKISIK